MALEKTPPPTSPQKDAKSLTTKEMELLTAVMKNCVADPVVNWSGVVADSGYNNEKTAREMYRVLKKKLGIASSPSKSSPPAAGVTKSSPKKIVRDKPIPVTVESPTQRRTREEAVPKTLAETMPVNTVQQELRKIHETETTKVPLREKRIKEEKDAEVGVFGQPEDVDTA